MKIAKILVISIFAASAGLAAGYKIPEQSLNATALSAAYVANASGADASYYNPANMVFNSKENEFDLNLTYITLPKMKYKPDSSNSLVSEDKSKSESFIIPTIHYILPYGNDEIKYGLSFVAPGGLSKRWDGSGKLFAQEFTLQIVELNPTISYKVNNDFSIGGGVRLVHTSGIVKSDGVTVLPATAGGGTMQISRDMEGDSIDYGYNLALSYKGIKNTNLSATYRSNVDLTVEGEADLTAKALTNTALAGLDGTTAYDASVTIPLPASLNLAVSHKIGKLTAELVYEKTYWSKYENLDFDYDKTVTHPILKDAFDNAKPKEWKDTNTYRLGLTYKLNNQFKIMGAYGKDETPVPNHTLGFELPDSDATIYSLGTNYKLDDSSNIGLAYLISIKDDRKVSSVNDQTAYGGEFTNSQVELLTFAYNKRF